MKRGDRVTVVMTESGLIPGSASIGDARAEAEFLSAPSEAGDVYRLKDWWSGKPYYLNGNSSAFVAIIPGSGESRVKDDR